MLLSQHRSAFCCLRASRRSTLTGKRPTSRVVLAWMPAASVFFHDPDGFLFARSNRDVSM